MDIWVATGSSRNLRISLEKGKWSVNRRLILRRELPRATYSSSMSRAPSAASWVSPVSRIRLRKTVFSGVTRLLLEGYYTPYRILFKTIFVLDENKWETGRIPVKDFNVSVRAGLNSLRNQDAMEKLLERIRGSWGVKV
ncbi:MAG: hypothetical protein QXF52_04610 [Thermoproteota archaeon]